MSPLARLPKATLAAAALCDAACTPEQVYADPKWPMLQHATIPLAVRIPLRGVRLRDVHALTEGVTLESAWPSSDEVPLYAGNVVLSWCEFEGSEETMAVRVTRLG